jgi:SAM-dependent methyltransferase
MVDHQESIETRATPDEVYDHVVAVDRVSDDSPEAPEDPGRGWTEYLDAFHAQRPGITEAVLGNASGENARNPYDWMLAAAAEHGRIVDVACGSGPLAADPAPGWIGLDRSPSEAALAASRTPGRVVVGDATALPFRSRAASTVACSMAIMLVDDPTSALVEMVRLLVPGGKLVALVPATAPLTSRDRLRYLRLHATGRLRHLPFRHDDLLDNLQERLADADLSLVSDERQRFTYRFADPDAGLTWLRSLYLPRLAPGRERALRRLVRRWTGSSIGIPLRRIVATTRAGR